MYTLRTMELGLIPPSMRRLADMMSPADGWLYRDAHYFNAELDVDPVAARKWVPAPLKLANPARATIFTGWFPQNTFGSNYKEVGLFLHVMHGRTRALFSPWMVVDDDVALILGRDLLGYPKKIGEIDFTIEGDRIVGVGRRRGTELVRMEGTLGERIANPTPMLGRPHRNVRMSMGLSLPKVLAFTPTEEFVEVRRADITVTIGGSERDPLSSLGFGQVRSAYLHRVNLRGGAFSTPLPVGLVNPLWGIKQWLLRAH